MVEALEVNRILTPEGPHQRDLLLAPPATVVEVLGKGFVLDVVPSRAYPKPEAPLTQEVYFGRLLGYQGRLTLGQDEDPGQESQLLSAGSHVGHQGEDLVDYAFVGVGPAGQLRVVLRVGAQDVVGDDQVVVPQLLDGLNELPDGSRVGPYLPLGESDSDLHLSPWPL